MQSRGIWTISLTFIGILLTLLGISDPDRFAIGLASLLGIICITSAIWLLPKLGVKQRRSSKQATSSDNQSYDSGYRKGYWDAHHRYIRSDAWANWLFFLLALFFGYWLGLTMSDDNAIQILVAAVCMSIAFWGKTLYYRRRWKRRKW